MTLTLVPFLEAIEDVSAGNVKIPQSEFRKSGDLAVVDQGQSLVAGYTENCNATVKSKGPLIVFGDHTRAFKYVDFPFAIGADGVKVLRTRDGFDPAFVFRYLQSSKIPSAGYSRHFKFLKELSIPKPPLDEQRRIAAILDYADALRAKRRQVLAHATALTRSVFREMFGNYTTEMERTDLQDLTEAITKGTTPTTLGLRFTQHGVPFLRAQNLQQGTVYFTLNDLHIDSAAHRSLRRSTIRPGDLLISIAGTIGRVAIVPKDAPEMNCNQAVAIVRLTDPSVGAWMMAWLNSPDAIRQINASAVTATISNLSLGQIRRLKVPAVKRGPMRSFTKRVALIQLWMRQSRLASNMTDELFASLQTRAFRGEL